jgi:hypothetical protein
VFDQLDIVAAQQAAVYGTGSYAALQSAAHVGDRNGSVGLGDVPQPGFSEDYLLGDLNVANSMTRRGELGDDGLAYVSVPEPASALLLVVAIAVGIMHTTRGNLRD